jgi:peptidoglycan/LPS O-acetylase OafA/YrhL
VQSESERQLRLGRSFDPRLSGLRGLAALGVVLFHEFTFHYIGIYFTIDYVTPGFLLQFTDTLYIGVPIFLMLSVFLLLGRLDKDPNLAHYFKRRIVRIWPIYFGTIIGVFLIFPYSLTQFVELATFSTYYVNFPFYPMATGQFWTLQVEELFYILLPLVAALTTRNRIRLSYSFITIGIIFVILSRIIPTIPFAHFIFFKTAADSNIGYLEQFLPLVLFAYGLGLLAYLGKLHSTKTRYLAFLGLTGLAMLPAISPTTEIFFEQSIFYFIALIGFAAIVANPFGVLKWFAFLGEESYALYAMHVAFLILFGLFVGLPLLIVSAFLVEFLSRRNQIIQRLKTAYFGHS